VFCDIEPETFCVTPSTVERVITPNTRALLPVHLFGIPAPVDALRPLAAERGIAILEDSAQAAGASLNGKRAGALGDAAAFSFFPSKNLFCLGDGGAIATDDEQVAMRARRLRQRGSSDNKRTFDEVGYNSRLDELQAAVLRVVLTRLDDWNQRRRSLAGEYAAERLSEIVSLPSVPPEAQPAYHLYVVRTDRRTLLVEALEEAGIEARPLYERPIHQQPAMEQFATGPDLPGTDAASKTSLALPMGPTRGAETARSVVQALRAVNSR
jgi:dTDP-4-amino-4,6-dideoxygalactose transaminase